MKTRLNTVANSIVSNSVKLFFLSFCFYAKNNGTTWANEFPAKRRPKMLLNCEKMTVTAAAEQKPEMTGPEMKSTRKPVPHAQIQIA